MRRSDLLAIASIGVVGLWFLATLRQGHEWGDDFSLYIQHARNLAEGKPYSETGYIYNPNFPSLSPRNYPPGLPLLLSPVIRYFGLNFEAMKVELTFVFLGFLLVVYYGWRSELPALPLLAVVLILGFNPYLWNFKDRILSEMPFILFSYLALWLLRELEDSHGTREGRCLLACAAGMALYLAFSTRSVGVVLLLALIAQALAGRYAPWRAIAVLVSFAVTYIGQRELLSSEGGYLDQLAFSPAQFAANFFSLVKAFGLFFDNGYSDGPRLALYGVLTSLALFGYVDRFRHRFTVAETYAPLYFGVIVIWPSSEWNPRFLLPLLPLYLLYAARGVCLLQPMLERRTEPLLRFALATALALSYIATYSRAEFGTLHEGVGSPDARELFQYVREQSRPDDVFLFQKPRALALFTGRRASALHQPRNDGDLWDYLDQIRARYIIIGQPFVVSRDTLLPFVERNSSRLTRVYANHDFTVYRIESVALAAR